VDKIIVLKDGCIQESGTFEELMNSNGEFAHLFTTHVHQGQEKKQEDEEKNEEKNEDQTKNQKQKDKKDAKLMTIEERDVGKVSCCLWIPIPKDSYWLFIHSSIHSIQIDFEIYLNYAKSFGGPIVIFCVFLSFFLDQAAQVTSNWSL
jgi:ABC-type Fe3+/spermidine/putrescine transport system ATPase subunit